MILTAVVVLGIIGLVLALILYIISKKFSVKEDPRVAQIVSLLPGANCGGGGLPGCAAFADNCVTNGSMKGMNCSVATSEVMAQVAQIVGDVVEQSTPKVAVVRCNGSCENRPRIATYDGTARCSIAHMMSGGDTGCSYGCLGCGDCVSVCKFSAISMNPQTGLPEVDEAKCTACGMCVKACPRSIIELRNRNKRDRRIYVSCMNKDKGAAAKRACSVACIGCGK